MIGFGSQDQRVVLERLRERLRKMPDAELIKIGKELASLCKPINPRGESPRNFVLQLEEARAEWRRRHPKIKSV